MRLRTQIAVLFLVPALSMVTLAMFELRDVLDRNRAATEVIKTVDFAIPIGNLINELQVERGVSAGFLASGGTTFTSEITSQRQKVDAAVAALAAFEGRVPDKLSEALRAALSAVRNATEIRGEISTLDTTVPDMAGRYTAAISQNILLQGKALSGIEISGMGKIGAGWLALTKAKEAAGLERAMGATGIGAGGFSPSIFNRFLNFGAVQTTHLEDAALFAEPVLGVVAFTSFPEFAGVDAIRTEVASGGGDISTLSITAPEWFALSTAWVERLRRVELELGEALSDVAMTEVAAARTYGYVMSAVVGIAMLGSIAWYIFVERSISRRTRALIHSMKCTAEKDFDFEIPYLADRSEFGDLSRSLDDMRSELYAADMTLSEAYTKSFAFGDSDAAMVIVSPERRVCAFNTSAEKLFLGQAANFRTVLTGWQGETVHSLDRNALLALIDGGGQCLADPGSLPIRTDVQVGDLKLEVNISYVQSEDGAYAGNVIQLRDVTQTRLHTGMIFAIERDQCVASISLDGTIQRLNDVFAKALGGSAEDFAGRPLKEFLAPDDPIHGTLSGFLAGIADGVGETPKLKLTQLGGGECWIRASINPVLDGNGRAYQISLIGEDITYGMERYRKETEAKERAEANRDFIVKSLADALDHVASGDLSYRITTPFAEEFDALRQNFNGTVEHLSDVMAGVRTNVDTLRHSSTELSSASGNLAKRTETQAATLTQSAAALEQVSASISATASDSAQADSVVAEARSAAQEGGETVKSAVAAMDSIASSSKEISKIISVIDNISFQTNLLALNAGVEAARAGEAGRGFSVVASEVRALAQRAAEAASEINTLITQSTEQVREGVALVGRAGDALSTIAGKVVTASERVADIRLATNEQATAVTEITASVHTMDQTTQQNAAMGEEASALSQSLRSDADELLTTVSVFKTETRDTARIKTARTKEDTATALAS
ncbi:MAG: methyl-accepting chemotaxis protein [Pseudomonadota bacterium]